MLGLLYDTAQEVFYRTKFSFKNPLRRVGFWGEFFELMQLVFCDNWALRNVVDIHHGDIRDSFCQE